MEDGQGGDGPDSRARRRGAYGRIFFVWVRVRGGREGGGGCEGARR
eukprot:CAMPEP_0179846944 /NCGR_PEP_ID=MMETSP0982-20121206/5819_1 /TAXON_ID=483367 /ORGANISM="non described non described, Strain CCMP 2436" /LENGTH=45 /DNA_ID= /DNA_START= /DNA_END= /DNA_ORIENTATION=